MVGGRLLGEGETTLRRVGSLDRAGEETLTFLASPKHLPEFRSSQAAAVLLTADLAKEPLGPRTRIVVDDPQRAMREAVLAMMPEPEPPTGVHPTASIGRGTTMGAGTTVGPHAVLGPDVRLGQRCRLGVGVVVEEGVTIGDDAVLDHNVVCYRGTTIGSRVWVKAGSVLGGTGFGFAPSTEGHLRIPHVGRCIIEDEVEIGSNCCVDRGTIDDTVVGRGTKLDNLIHVAHNVRIGERCLLMGGVGLGGSVTIGDEAILAGQVGVADHVVIGSSARVAAQSGVMGEVPPKATFGGTPARSHRLWLRGQVALDRLASIAGALEALVAERKRRG